MKPNETDFSLATNSLATGIFEQIHRGAIENVVASGAASRLIHDTLTVIQSTGGNDERAVQHLMKRLEALAEISPLSARILMVTLWPIAGRLLLHDVCDAIDLWIVNKMSEDLRHQLRQMMESEGDERGRMHLERLLKNHA